MLNAAMKSHHGDDHAFPIGSQIQHALQQLFFKKSAYHDE